MKLACSLFSGHQHCGAGRHNIRVNLALEAMEILDEQTAELARLYIIRFATAPGGTRIEDSSIDSRYGDWNLEAK